MATKGRSKDKRGGKINVSVPAPKVDDATREAIAAVKSAERNAATHWPVIWSYAASTDASREAVATALYRAGLAKVKVASVTQYRNGHAALVALLAVKGGKASDATRDGVALIVARHVGNGVGGTRLTEWVEAVKAVLAANPRRTLVKAVEDTPLPERRPVKRQPRTKGDGTAKGGDKGPAKDEGKVKVNALEALSLSALVREVTRRVDDVESVTPDQAQALAALALVLTKNQAKVAVRKGDKVPA